jgi:hypothetical protein
LRAKQPFPDTAIAALLEKMSGPVRFHHRKQRAKGGIFSAFFTNFGFSAPKSHLPKSSFWRSIPFCDTVLVYREKPELSSDFSLFGQKNSGLAAHCGTPGCVLVRSNLGLDFFVFYVVVKIRFGILSIVTPPQKSHDFPFCVLFRGVAGQRRPRVGDPGSGQGPVPRCMGRAALETPAVSL